ncbi:MAG: YggS family pyridoxal phosphate-dependent enzyme [Firmicutes bacterium]|nr:YggS family pyridoxal phosphate-dependent enzyme [Bacillota bacterium]
MMKNLENNIKEVFQKITKSCHEVGRKENEVTLLAATKTVSSDLIKLLPSCGVTAVGENRAQELCSKYDENIELNWHFVGHLQTNKVKQVIDKVSLIHSLDRPSLAEEVDKQAQKIGKIQDILIEINVGGEEAKSGISAGEIDTFYDFVRSKKHLNLKGIMTVLPINAPDNLYRTMQDIFLKLQEKDNNITILSMGMSDDFEKSIKYGSTMVRIGSAIFGGRQ